MANSWKRIEGLFMIRFICTVIGLIIGMTPGFLYAAEVPSVLILPFGIQATPEQPQLQKQITEMMEAHLKFQGFEILKPEKEEAFGTGVATLDSMGQAGEKAGADYVLWGNVGLVEKALSIEAKIMSTGTRNPSSFHFQSKDEENVLYEGTRQIAVEITAKLLNKARIADVKISGNVRIEAEVIKRQIKTAPGDVFSEKQISEDLKSLYAMGYFDDVRISAEDTAKGKAVSFQIKEKPTIRNIVIKAGKVINEEKIRENLTISTGAILNIFKLQSNVKIIETLYKDKKYYNVKVTYEIKELENNQADLTFLIEEGEKIRIKKITFEGNSAYPDKLLKKTIKTSEKGWFSWITSSGEYNIEQLNQDTEILSDYYLNHGYIESRIGDPVVKFEKDKIFVTFKIHEGKQFAVGGVDIEGDLIKPREEMMEKLKIKNEKFFSRKKVQEDILAMTDIYSDEGYAFPEILPMIKPDHEKLTVDITFNIDKGKEVYFQKINITGNTRTRDKVIRRELKVTEQGKYSGKLLKRSVRNLHRLDYFEDVKVERSKGSDDSKMDLDLQVVEKSTGMISFGAGYSSVENLYGMVSLTEKNLFGRGQTAEIKAELGGVTTKFDVSFTEPWLFDIPLSAGVNLYNWKVQYDDYDKDGKGGSLSFGYPVFDYTRIYVSYAYDESVINNISYFASKEIKNLAGNNVTSSVSTALRYDSRDKTFNATEGAKHSLSAEYAGLGGNIGFIKYLAETGWYYPFYKELVLFFHGKTGFIHENAGKTLPDYEKFYLGGINSIRGFGWQGIHSLDNEGYSVGGDKFVQGNIELNLPIIKGAGLMAVLFFDTGEVYKRTESIDLSDLSESVGGGFRWYSPMGPMRIEYGYILDPKEGQGSGGKWEFSVGGVF
ncbi:MAG: outer membrane protein assembly factor BamA [Desulfobacteraceae bacterium]|nr:outer membrane protein assembly factor BamA [Desulfobacteraceae bacterium]